jgi:hypothetical protein
MKKALGTLALMAVSAAAFVMPAAAHDRDDRFVSQREVVVVRHDRRAPVRVYNRYPVVRECR